MSIEFDPKKDAINRAKHRLSLAVAESMNLDAALVQTDQRRLYSEARMVALGPISGRLHVLVYVIRAGKVRAISLRKANDREKRRYEQAF